MIGGTYLTFGFALGFLILRPDRREKTAERGIFYLKLSLALSALITFDSLLSAFLWNPSGRGDLGLVSLILSAVVIDEGAQRIGKTERLRTQIPLLTNRSLIPLLAFSLWTMGREEGRLLRGLLLVIGTGILEWLLGGLRERLRLAQVPRALEGVPILFWLSAVLFLAFYGFHRMGAHL